ncbi:MAG: terminase small subunit, partial [Chloroflexi bacterium]|nr:terminase small subunit [Chloroflexota bacterium]
MLQTKRQSFAREFLVDRNATKAAERAGYSVHTAKQQGSRLLTFVDV